MIAPRSSGPLRSNDRGSSGIVIREGFKPLIRQEHIDGKGKNVVVDELDAQKKMNGKCILGRSTEDGSVSLESQKDDSLKCIGEVAEAWLKPKPIKITFDRDHMEFSEDGVAVKLNAERDLENSKVLKNSIVLKVLGNSVPFPFNSGEVVDEILNGGPWYVNGLSVGMDRWTPAFDPKSFKGISAPDEESIARIASCFGSPMYVDGNTFRWSKRQFTRVCVRIDLEKKLLNGAWVESSAGRFFQRVEYEKIDLLCYQCRRVGHDKKICPDNAL
ncbi:uncharacterized protein LOC110102225 [Dendrobium catenatum]|uniref:uncharacterized protein LOC110102225 n=1 Tax=Dendrobium catenatum TaxID=906689 RepID=UPI0009F5DC0F|nr:uncharacterized protein LOC110102225 [Dendrobium catenatum]